MIERYTKIRNAIGDIVLANIQLSPAEKNIITIILKKIIELDVLEKTFQDRSMYMCYVRNYLAAEAKSFLKIEQYYSKHSDIIEDMSFELALVKIQKAELQ